MTPAQRVIRSKNKEIVQNWNRARFRRLAMMLELTEGELGDMAYSPPSLLKRYLKANKFPDAVAGHLENIERWVKQSRLRIKLPPTAQDQILHDKVKELT